MTGDSISISILVLYSSTLNAAHQHIVQIILQRTGRRRV